ncbi:IS3 family transposase [Paenibacillus larvae]|nr:IS3 family transposase [Paenibacillus larvae]MDT2295288.1 IS3 family transposase [Paenibacillus larvae]
MRTFSARYSYQANGTKVPDEQIQERLMELISSDGFAYGYRKLTVCLRREYQLQINKKKVYRLRASRTSCAHNDRNLLCIHENWLVTERLLTPTSSSETDIKYGFIAGEERFFFIQSCIDVYDRSIVAFHIGLSCEAKDVASTLQSALMKRQLFEALENPVIRSDNGPQFISCLSTSLYKLRVEHERIPPKTPNMNVTLSHFIDFSKMSVWHGTNSDVRRSLPGCY